jgi:hypothetical protein
MRSLEKLMGATRDLQWLEGLSVKSVEKTEKRLSLLMSNGVWVHIDPGVAIERRDYISVCQYKDGDDWTPNDEA